MFRQNSVIQQVTRFIAIHYLNKSIRCINTNRNNLRYIITQRCKDVIIETACCVLVSNKDHSVLCSNIFDQYTHLMYIRMYICIYQYIHTLNESDSSHRSVLASQQVIQPSELCTSLQNTQQTLTYTSVHTRNKEMAYFCRVLSIATLLLIISASVSRCNPISNHHVSHKRLKNLFKNQVLNKLGLEHFPDVSRANVSVTETRNMLKEYRRSLEETSVEWRRLYADTSSSRKQFNTFPVRLGKSLTS